MDFFWEGVPSLSNEKGFDIIHTVVTQKCDRIGGLENLIELMRCEEVLKTSQLSL